MLELHFPIHRINTIPKVTLHLLYRSVEQMIPDHIPTLITNSEQDTSTPGNVLPLSHSDINFHHSDEYIDDSLYFLPSPREYLSFISANKGTGPSDSARTPMEHPPTPGPVSALHTGQPPLESIPQSLSLSPPPEQLEDVLNTVTLKV